MNPIRCMMLGLVKRTVCKMAFSVSMDGIKPGSVSGVEALGPAAEARDEFMIDVDVSLEGEVAT